MEGLLCTWILVFSVLATCYCSNGIGVMHKRIRSFNKKLNNFKTELVQMDTDLHDSIDIAKESLRLDLRQLIKQQFDEAMAEFRESESVPEVDSPNFDSEIRKLKQGHYHMKRQLHRDVQQEKNMYRDAFNKAERSLNESCSKCNTKLLSRVLKQCKRRVVQTHPGNKKFFKEANNKTSDHKKLSNCKQEIEETTSSPISSTTTTTISPPSTSTSVQQPPVMNRLIIGQYWSSELSQMNLQSNRLSKYPLLVSGRVSSLCYVQRLQRLLVGTYPIKRIMSTTLDGGDTRTLREDVYVKGMSVDEERKLVFMTKWSPGQSISRMTTQGKKFKVIRNLTGKYSYPRALVVNSREREIYASVVSRVIKLNYNGKLIRYLAPGDIWAVSFDNVRNILYFNDGKTLKKMSMSDKVVSDVTTLSVVVPNTLAYYNDTVYYGGFGDTLYVGKVQLGEKIVNTRLQKLSSEYNNALVICLVP